MTPAQVHLVRYFAGRPTGPDVPLRALTYQAARRRGWIEEIDEFPFHRTTALGLQKLDEHEAATPSA